MTIYDFEVTITGSVHADSGYDATEKLEEKIKSGELSPDELKMVERGED